MMWAGSLRALVNTFLYHRLVKGLGKTHQLQLYKAVSLTLSRRVIFLYAYTHLDIGVDVVFIQIYVDI